MKQNNAMMVMKHNSFPVSDSGTMVKHDDTLVVNSEAGTLVDTDLGTMIINDSDEEESTMKSKCWVQ